MPPRHKKDCLIILVNVGCTDEKEDENEESFLEKSKLLMKLLIQRRIFLRPKDEIGIILMGTSETNNRLEYENVVELNPLQIPSWDLIKRIKKLRGTKESAVWVDGMNVVLEYINAECVDNNSAKTVVLLTDFNEESDVIEQYDAKTIAADIQAADINLLAIGNKSLNGDSQIKLNSSEELFATVCKMVHGQTMTFNDSIPKLMIYKDKSKTPMPWKVDLDLFDIEIPVIMYLKTTEDFKLPTCQLFTDTETTKVPVERSRALVDKNREEVGTDDIIAGHMYGRKFIPFSDEDQAALKYESGPKGFMIYGFTKQKLISLDCLAGNGSYIVVPGQQSVASPFYSLVKAMADKKKVAIVRRVFRANSAPKMGVLFPKINVPGHPWCLVYIELIFAEDRRIVQVKPIKSSMNELADEQEEVIDDLIDSMMLMDVEDDSTKETKEAFEAGTVPDVSRQYVWDKLTHRALNPGSTLPPMSDFLNKFLEPPKSVQHKSKPILKQIQRLFPMKIVQKKVYVKKRSNKQSDDPAPDVEELVEITEDVDATRLQTDFEHNTQGMETEDEELARIADSIEAASQGMDIDLDELAKDM